MVLSDDIGRVLLLTLNRPEALNAFNGALFDALIADVFNAQKWPQCPGRRQYTW